MPGDVKLIEGYAVLAKRMLFDVATFFDNNSIKYILDYGTLLGIVRENRLLPWDSDMDLSITDEFVEQFLRNRWKLWLKGYRTRVRRYKKDVGPYKKGDIRIIKIQTRRFLFFRGLRLMDLFVKKEIDGEYCYTVAEKPFILKSVPLKFHNELTEIEFDNKKYSAPKPAFRPKKSNASLIVFLSSSDNLRSQSSLQSTLPSTLYSMSSPSLLPSTDGIHSINSPKK